MKIYIFFTINAMGGFGPGECNESSSTECRAPAASRPGRRKHLYWNTSRRTHLILSDEPETKNEEALTHTTHNSTMRHIMSRSKQHH